MRVYVASDFHIHDTDNPWLFTSAKERIFDSTGHQGSVFCRTVGIAPFHRRISMKVLALPREGNPGMVASSNWNHGG